MPTDTARTAPRPAAAPPLPLAGLTIVDMTSVVMGPSCTQALGDMGADVIKVESPVGDTMRGTGPARNPGMGANFLNANRSKRSIVLDLKKPAALTALRKLLETADILVYNVRPQAMTRLGLSWDEVHALNPRLIYAGMYGYGQDGEYAALPAYDDLIQAAGGMATLFSHGTDQPPRYVPSAIADRITGLSALGVILAAVIERHGSGIGRRVDIPMLETMAAFVLADHMGGRTFEPPLGSVGYARQLSPQRKPYRTQDGYISVLVYNDSHWKNFLEIIGRGQSFYDDPRYRSVTSRLAHIDALYAEVEDAMPSRSTQEWLQVLRAADIPAMPVHSLDSLFDDPHLRQTGFFQQVSHPTEGALLDMRGTSTWNGAPLAPTRPAPRLGEHTESVLREAGLQEADIAALVADQAAGARYQPAASAKA